MEFALEDVGEAMTSSNCSTWRASSKRDSIRRKNVDRLMRLYGDTYVDINVPAGAVEEGEARLLYTGDRAGWFSSESTA